MVNILPVGNLDDLYPPKLTVDREFVPGPALKSRERLKSTDLEEFHMFIIFHDLLLYLLRLTKSWT